MSTSNGGAMTLHLATLAGWHRFERDGDAWTPTGRALTYWSASCLAVEPADPAVVYVGSERSGLFVSTGIGAPDVAPVVQREQCWAGYCGGTFPSRTGDLVKSATGRYATAFASRGAASAKKNPADSSGRGWTAG